uniref:hypothetical protein n=1 Tax=Natronobacterium sp. AS-7091 TaxID=198929 RepID=UPI001865C54D|nr:hypothetical protein [Natronobacterium sp. AS-7091]
MAKKNVSARVPPQIADGIDEYAEAWNLNRTEAMTALLGFAVQNAPDPREVDVDADVNPAERVYTLELEPENAEHVEDSDVSVEQAINNVLSVYSG